MPLHARELHLSPRPNRGDTEQPGTRLETSPPAPAPHLGPARSVWPPALWQMAAGWPPDPLPGHTDVGEPSGEAASRKTGRKPSPPHSHRDVVTGSRKKTHTHTVSSVLRAHRPWEAVGPRAWVPRPARPLTSGATHPPRASVPSPRRREGGRPPREAVSGPREKAKGKEPPPSKVEETSASGPESANWKPSGQTCPHAYLAWQNFFFFLKSEFVANMKNLRASQQNAVLSVF